jgi:hypothetical protein
MTVNSQEVKKQKFLSSEDITKGSSQRSGLNNAAREAEKMLWK